MEEPCETTHLVDLGDHGVQYFALERSEHDGLVLDGIEYKAAAGLNEAGADSVNSCHGNNESVSVIDNDDGISKSCK